MQDKSHILKLYYPQSAQKQENLITYKKILKKSGRCFRCCQNKIGYLQSDTVSRTEKINQRE